MSELECLQLLAELGVRGFVLPDLYTALPEFLDSTLLWYWELTWELQLWRVCTNWLLCFPRFEAAASLETNLMSEHGASPAPCWTRWGRFRTPWPLHSSARIPWFYIVVILRTDLRAAAADDVLLNILRSSQISQIRRSWMKTDLMSELEFLQLLAEMGEEVSYSLTSTQLCQNSLTLLFCDIENWLESCSCGWYVLPQQLPTRSSHIPRLDAAASMKTDLMSELELLQIPAEQGEGSFLLTVLYTAAKINMFYIAVIFRTDLRAAATDDAAARLKTGLMSDWSFSSSLLNWVREVSNSLISTQLRQNS